MTRVAILGLGGAARELHLPACGMLEGVEVVGGCDPDPQRLEAVGRRHRIRHLGADPDALLRRSRPEIAIVAAPPNRHHELCLLALEHGASVFCEKPFVSTVDQADEVILAAERRGLTVMVNNQYRNGRIYRESRRQIASGALGRPFLAQCWQQMFHPPSSESNWHADLIQSTLFEFGTHPLDLLSYFFDALPETITAHIPRPVPDIRADVVVQATLRYPGERLATLIFNRISHAAQRYLEMRVDCEQASLRISFGGLARVAVEWSGGLPAVRLSLVRGGEARVEAAGRSRVIARDRRDFRAYATAVALSALIEARRSGSLANDQARHAREILRVVFAGYESARTGRTVTLGGA